MLSNHPKLTRTCPVGLLPSSNHCGRQVRVRRKQAYREGFRPWCELGACCVHSNHPELMRNCPVGLLRHESQWFIDVRSGLTTPSSLETAFEASLPLHHSGSRVLCAIEPPKTHSKLPCRPASPCITVVRGCCVLSNHPKHTQNCHVGLLPLSAMWFEEVRRGRTTPNSLETALYSRVATTLQSNFCNEF